MIALSKGLTLVVVKKKKKDIFTFSTSTGNMNASGEKEFKELLLLPTGTAPAGTASY